MINIRLTEFITCAIRNAVWGFVWFHQCNWEESCTAWISLVRGRVLKKLSCPLSVHETEIHFSRFGEVASSGAVAISIKGLRMVIMFTYQQSD